MHPLPLVPGDTAKNRLQRSKTAETGLTGGETGIRTLGGLAPTTVFETAPFDHSGTSPRGSVGGASNGLFIGRQGRNMNFSPLLKKASEGRSKTHDIGEDFGERLHTFERNCISAAEIEDDKSLIGFRLSGADVGVSQYTRRSKIV